MKFKIQEIKENGRRNQSLEEANALKQPRKPLKEKFCERDKLLEGKQSAAGTLPEILQQILPEGFQTT